MNHVNVSAIKELVRSAKASNERGDRQSTASALSSALSILDQMNPVCEKRVLNG